MDRSMVPELYDALRQAGVDDAMARRAAEAVLGARHATELATKADLALLGAEFKADLAELKADVIKWNVAAMMVLTAIFAAITRLG
jgi:hypothetical protein